MLTHAKTWWTILRITLEERLVYRADFAVATLMRFLPILTQVFLWSAIFAAANTDSVAGYSYHNFIAYYLLVMVGRALSSMPNLSAGITLQIREGEIKKFLIQPIDLISFLLIARVAHKLVYYVIAAAPFAIIFFLCRGFFPGWPDGLTLAAFFAALIMAFLLGFFLELAIGLVGFWWLEVGSILFIYMMINYFLSGHMFPIDMLPQPWQAIVNCLPFRFLAYFPAAIFLGKVHGNELIQELWIQFAWVVFFFFLSRILFHFGVKRYSGFGG